MFRISRNKTFNERNKTKLQLPTKIHSSLGPFRTRSYKAEESSTLEGTSITAQCAHVWSCVLTKEYIAVNNTKQPLLVFIPGTFYPRKQEAVKKTTSELLSAVLRSLLCGVCVYLACVLCTLYCTLYTVQ